MRRHEGAGTPHCAPNRLRVHRSAAIGLPKEAQSRLMLTRRTFQALALAAVSPAGFAQGAKMQSWKLATSRRTGIHDLAPAPDGGVWFTAQASGHLGWFDPA